MLALVPARKIHTLSWSWAPPGALALALTWIVASVRSVHGRSVASTAPSVTEASPDDVPPDLRQRAAVHPILVGPTESHDQRKGRRSLWVNASPPMDLVAGGGHALVGA